MANKKEVLKIIEEEIKVINESQSSPERKYRAQLWRERNRDERDEKTARYTKWTLWIAGATLLVSAITLFATIKGWVIK